jgi:signal peptidase II
LSFAADQGSKLLVRWAMPSGTAWSPIAGTEDWFSVRVSMNSGAAFGLLQGAGAVLVFAAVVALVLILGLYITQTRMAQAVALGLGLIAGGTAGNLLDRLRLGGVVDWLQLPLVPAFNLADVWLLLGAAVLLVWGLRRGAR